LRANKSHLSVLSAGTLVNGGLAPLLLIVAELVVHQRMRLVVGTFVKLGLVPDEARARFDAAIAAAIRLRNSPTKQ